MLDSSKAHKPRKSQLAAETSENPSTADVSASNGVAFDSQSVVRPPVTSTATTNGSAYSGTHESAAPESTPGESRKAPSKVLLGYFIFAVLGILGALVSWRTLGSTDLGSAVRMAGAGGSLAAAATCMFVVNLNTGRSRAWQTPWIIITAALLARVMWEFMAYNGARAATPRPASNLLLLVSCAVLAVGVWLWTSRVADQNASGEEDPPSSGGSHSVAWVLDAILIGGGLAAIVWWMLRAPALAGTTAKTLKAASSTGIGYWILALDLAVLAMAALALVKSRSTSHLQNKSLPLVFATVSALILVAADARLLDATTKTSLSLLDLGLRFLGPFLIGLAALSEAKRAFASDVDEPKNAISASTLPLLELQQLLALAFPAIAVLIMTWRLATPAIRSGVFVNAPSQVWWAPTLLLLLVVRYALGLRGSGAGLANSAQLRRQVSELKETVDRRTMQLSTLHSVTADISNSLNSEQILMTAIERTMAALGAQAGAVWLYLDVNEIESNEEGQRAIIAGESASRAVSNATFVWRELERSSTERMALDSLRAKPMNPLSSDASFNEPARLEKRWSLVLSRGHEHAGARALLTELHRGLESPEGMTRFENAGRFDPNASDIQQSTFVQNNAHIHATPIRSKGELLGALGVVREDTPLDTSERALVAALALEVGAALQNVQLYQEASRLADRDSLTDLLNHRAIQQQLNQLLSRAQRSETDLGVIMMDLSNFKFFNDTYGHPEGDRVLRTVAQCLREACRGSDIIGRFGGDEFIALLLDTDTQGALHVCRRIASRVEEEGYQQRGDKRRIPINLSFGAAVYPHDGTTAMELLTVADANLYEAKRGGAPMMIKRNAAEETQELRKLKDAGTGGSFGVLDALVTAIDNKDHYTRSHSEDVTHWATLMARELGYSSETQRAVRIAGLLHDVGKIAVPDSILRKPGRLNDDEFQIMQQHPVFGALIVKDVPNLTEVLGGIRHHHERFDGKGYPDKLSTDAIPLLGRLLAVPDCFSAMTTDRPYRKALTWSEALDEIEKGKGTQFDPVMADAFLEVMARIISEQASLSMSTTEDALQTPIPDDKGKREPGSAADIARRMADPDAIIVTPQDDASLRPRSVADAETVV
jgi:diguanylate cyclase (GGDEF)-like protein/putative nucleotidyltransferase with HDIG domain